MTVPFEARKRPNGTFGVWCVGAQKWAVHPTKTETPYEFEDEADAKDLAEQWVATV
ncbi:hypothetical protein [Lentzea sp. CA-135723]|uniref:hypothetical protein n=1 Tax=Lentzea sp. CA-135723 TaxID=3239950 RepID=UPI003D8B652F